MTLPTSGQLDMGSINAEFGRGYDLNAYRGVQWWKDDGSTGYFSAGQISMAEFYGTRRDSPIPAPGFAAAIVVGGNGPSWTSSQQYIGKANPKRVVVVAVATGDTSASPITSVTIGGVAATLGARASGSGNMRCCAVYYLAYPNGENADIRVVANNNASSCLISTYAIYPNNPAPIDSGSDITTATTTNISVASQSGGYIVGTSHHRNTNGTNWGGTAGFPWSVNYNATVGGVNASTAWATTAGQSGNASMSWSGSVNGSSAVVLWGP